MRWRLSKLDWPYAVGELIIVTVGVLIALAIDQWNSDRLERVEELQFVDQLIADLNFDLGGFEAELRDLDLKEASLRRIQSILATADLSVENPEDFLRDIVRGSVRGWV